jgi:hypothetical protein
MKMRIAKTVIAVLFSAALTLTPSSAHAGETGTLGSTPQSVAPTQTRIDFGAAGGPSCTHYALAPGKNVVGGASWIVGEGLIVCNVVPTSCTEHIFVEKWDVYFQLWDKIEVTDVYRSACPRRAGSNVSYWSRNYGCGRPYYEDRYRNHIFVTVEYQGDIESREVYSIPATYACSST